MAAPRPINKMRQFMAILRKNFILQTRGRRTLLGIGGLAGLILQVLLPVSFFLVMYLPKYYIKPFPHAESLGAPPVRLESRSWAEPYDGPATFHSHGGRASLILTPDVPEVRGLAVVLARTLACPRDPRFRICPSANMPASFHCMFMPPYGVYGTNSTNGISSNAYGAAAAEGEGNVGGVDDRVAGKRERDGVDGSGGGGGVTGWPYRTTAGGRDSGDGGGDGGVWSPGGFGYRRRQRLRLRHKQVLENDIGGSKRITAAAAAAVADTEVDRQDDAAVLAAGDTCTNFSICVVTPACYEHVLRNQITFMPSQEAARRATVSADQKWDAVVHFPRAGPLSSPPSPATAAADLNKDSSAMKAEKGISEGVGFGATDDVVGGKNDGFGSKSLLRHSNLKLDNLNSNLSSQFSISELLSSVVIGMNHSDVPPTRFILDLFEVAPSTSNGLALYKRYWFFANLQLAIQKAVTGIHVAANSNEAPPPSAPLTVAPPPSPLHAMTTDQAAVFAASQRKPLSSHSSSWVGAGNPYDNAVPANVEVSYKAFPWPAVTEDLGAALAAVFFQLLLVFAFLSPTCAVVGDIVREKELRLREGMRVLGLTEPSYWLSWGLTHWLLLALSGALCTAAGTYPFSNSSAGAMLTYFWLYGAALVSYGYCLSTLFSSSRVAGTVVILMYTLSMLPGFVLPVVYPYGSWTWYVACLAPPSAATLYANVLINWELVAKGIRLSTLWTPITQTNGFCAATVLWMLALDVVLYGILAWYLDNVLPKSYGQRLPWWFIFDRRYWASKRGGRADGGGGGGGGGGGNSGGMGSSNGGGRWRRLRWWLLDLRKAVTWVWRGNGGGGGDGDGNPSLFRPLLGSSRGDGGINDGECRTSVLPVSERDSRLHGMLPAVEVRGLVKVFQTLTGEDKVAVDHLDLQIASGRITALLGHNGAGKTTTIHILTGMLQPTAGSATVNGFDVATQMDLVRSSLGICPQFDILWPDLTVYEHLELYGAIKGYLRVEIPELAAAAAAKVGLTSKLHSLAGELSGGQRRKLSVAIAFLGNPAVVFLDEPTSGMDPYSRRFTWEVIRQHRSESAIVLTTHSMEEADLLGDRVVILARGRVAAQGTGMELKANYGVGYNLTLVVAPRQHQHQHQHSQLPGGKPATAAEPALAQDSATASATAPEATAAAAAAGTPPSPEAAVMAVVRRHVPAADLLSAAGAEVVVRLPREATSSFPALLRELDGPVGRQQLGVASYGLSLTTLEEVFLAITAAAEEQQQQQQQQGPPQPPPPPPVHPAPLYGWRLYGQQLRALFTKRALCARRDRLAVLTQVAVPLALVYLALWISSFQVRETSEPPLELSRRTALFGRPLAWSASPAVRNASEGCSGGGGGGGSSSRCLAAFLASHPAGARAVDSGATAPYNPGDPKARSTTLEDYLVRHWYGGDVGPVYDALHITSLPPPATLAAALLPPSSPLSPPPPQAPLSFVLLTNQSAISALPAALADAMTAVLSYINGGLQPPAVAAPAEPPPSFSAVSWPLPILETELVAQIKRDAARLMLVLCLLLASSVLSASFVVFIVREQDNNSKHLQLVSGAPATAYWAANFCCDFISYSLSAAGLLALIASYRLPQYSGQRLAAVAGLLWGFGPAGISLTYLLHFFFRDEMRALQRLNTIYFLTGYLGFVATWIADLILMVVPRSGSSLASWNRAAKATLRTASPHYCFARGMYDVQSTYDTGFPFGKRGKPFDWDVFGSPMAHMAVQALVYGSIAVLYDAGVLTVAYAYGQDAARWILSFGRRRRRRQQRRGGRLWRYGNGGAATADGRDAAQLVELEEGLSAAAAAGDTETKWAQCGSGGYGDGDGDDLDDDDDDDVAAERQAVVEGRRNNCPVLLAGVRKSYSQGWSRPAVAAVRGLWVGVPAGECFGLLGANGAGKTTTFRMLTGEVMPDAGDARVAGFSVRKQLAAARRQLGYCPQFEALPGAMTGREVAAMYARLRGVPEPYVAGLVSYLLKRLGLEGAADSPCGGYSGGMKRKLGVAVALVGDPRVCALDEPSTGMDPGARRGLWTCLQNEVIRAGRTVVLTSHSMEECEALCTSLTIMVAGRLRCLGTVQHLKSRFGGGYILEIKLQPASASNPSLASGPSPPPPLPPLPQSSHSVSPGGGVAATTATAATGADASSSSSPAAAAAAVLSVNDAAARAATLTEWVASVCPGAVLSYMDQNCFTFSLPREAVAAAENSDNPDADAGGSQPPYSLPPSPPSPRQQDQQQQRQQQQMQQMQQMQQQQRHLDLAALFEAVESQRAALGVADYCLTQTTLEQLFVSMAASSTTNTTTSTT